MVIINSFINYRREGKSLFGLTLQIFIMGEEETVRDKKGKKKIFDPSLILNLNLQRVADFHRHFLFLFYSGVLSFFFFSKGEIFMHITYSLGYEKEQVAIIAFGDAFIPCKTLKVRTEKLVYCNI